MAEAHYPLQALLYSVALHRYLRWRQPAYDPDRHLGGVLYLFLRGMSATEPTLFGSAPVRGLVVASSGRPGHGAERSLRPRCTPVTTVETGDVGLDRYDVSVAAGASGSLQAFNRAGILDGSDVHVAHRLAQLAGVSGEDVSLGIAFAVRAPRLGHVCVDLRTIRETASGDVDLPPTSTRCPGPIHLHGSTPWT